MKNKVLKILTYSFIYLIIFLSPRITHAALLYSGAANEVTYEKHTFVVEWYLDTQGQTINSVNLKLNFSKDTLQVLNTEAGSSDLNLWVKTPTADNSKGTIELIGGVAGGLNTSKMKLFRSVFMPKAPGPAQISADISSSVLLNDGKGTSLKLSFMPLNFPVVEGTSTAATVVSTTHPDETVWYRNNSPELVVYPKDGEVYSYSFSSNPEITPDATVDDVSKKFTFSNLPDGIYYFKLAFKVGDGWQEDLVYRFQIDKTQPEEFHANIASDPSIFSGRPFASFATTDKTSGIDHYEIQVNGIGPWSHTTATYFQLPKLWFNDKVQVRAVDLAGNTRLAEINYNLPNQGFNFSNFIFWTIIIVGLLLLLVLVRFIVKKTKVGPHEQIKK